MTLRNRISVAAAAGVLVVVSAVSIVLYLSYDASLRSRVDPALVDAAQQANTVAQRIKQSAGDTGVTPDVSAPVTIGSVDIQLFPEPVVGQPTRFGPLSSRDVAVASGDQAAYFTNAHDGGKRYRVYTAAMPNSVGGFLVRTSRAADADDAALSRPTSSGPPFRSRADMSRVRVTCSAAAVSLPIGRRTRPAVSRAAA